MLYAKDFKNEEALSCEDHHYAMVLTIKCVQLNKITIAIWIF